MLVARLLFLHRLQTASAIRAAPTVAALVQRPLQRGRIVRTQLASAASQAAQVTTAAGGSMADGNGSSALPQEVEALRKQVEQLQVSHVGDGWLPPPPPAGGCCRRAAA